MRFFPKLVIPGFLLSIVHVAVLATFGTHHPGPLLSDLIQLALGVLVIVACLQAARRSDSFGRYFWKITTVAYSLWVVAQLLGTFSNFLNDSRSSSRLGALPWLVEMSFTFWFIPFGVTLFLDPDDEPKGFDWLLILDFIQTVVFLIAAYLYFFLIPSAQSQSAHSVWAPFFICYGLMVGAFILRACLTSSDTARSLFGRMGIFLAIAGCVDLVYCYGPGRGSVSGGWFDLLWALMLIVPLLIAATWDRAGHTKPTRAEPVHAHTLVFAQLFPLLYPALVLVMSAKIAQERIAMAFMAIVLSFACSSARLIITQLRQQQSTKEVRRSCSLLAAVAEGTSDAIFVKDRSGRYLMINAAGAQLLGKTVAEVIGRTDLELFSPESAQTIMDGDRRVMDSGKTQTYEDVGTAAGVTRIYLSTKGPYRDAEGNIIGLIGIAVDITSRKRAEEALQGQALAMEASDDGMAILNAGGEYVYVNSAYVRIFGFERPENLLGRNWRILYQADEVERFERHILPAMRSEGRWEGEALGRKQDGKVFPQELGLTALKDGGLISVCRDISDRRRVQEQLAQSQRMEAIGRFAGGIAHDFNNLLTVIHGYSHLALGDLRHEQTVESCVERIERIENAADRAASLTRQLLAFSRQQVLQPEIIDLNQLVVNLGKMLHRLIGEDVEILTETDASLGLIKADPTQMEQVIMNLVLNARDAMPQGGKLILETANVDINHEDPRNHAGVPPGSYVTLAVSDNGTGMDPETQSHIFEPFFTTKESGRGTGLGLSTVYGIVQQSEGHISFSTELRRGTTFRIYLPRTSDGVPATTFPHRSLTISGGDETILLVEDDQQVRQLAQSILTSCGYSVLAPESALEAMPVCVQYSSTIHLLLTDVVMPGINGCELAKQVVGNRPTTRVLYMSGYRDNPAIGDCLLDDGTFFLEKPFTPVLLAHKVREALDRN